MRSILARAVVFPVWFANGNRPLVNAASSNAPSDFTIVPNPAQEWIEIKGLSLDQIQSIQIMGLDGKVVSNVRWERSENRINVRQLPAGMYWIVVSGPQVWLQSSFIKQ